MHLGRFMLLAKSGWSNLKLDAFYCPHCACFCWVLLCCCFSDLENSSGSFFNSWGLLDVMPCWFRLLKFLQLVVLIRFVACVGCVGCVLVLL